MTTIAVEDSRSRRLPRSLLLGMWAALTIALVLAIRELPWAQTLEQFRSLSAAFVVLAICANVIPFPLWAAEWRLLIPGARVAYGRVFEVVSVTGTVLNSVPFFAGEASGVALLIGRLGLSRGAALSVLAMDQLLVGVAKLVVLAAAAVFAPLPPWLRAGVLSLLMGVSALLAVLFLLAHRWTAIRGYLDTLSSRAARFAAAIVSWGTHLEALRERRRIWPIALLALAKKSAELLGIIAVQAAFGMDVSIGGGLLVLAALSIATMLPVAPANLGVYEGTVFLTYRYLGVSAETALGLAIVQHVCFLLPALGTGYLTLAVRQLAPRYVRAR